MTIREALKQAHADIAVWYGYLVGASITLQETWSQMDEYIPKRLRHAVLGLVTVIVIIDKIHARLKKGATP